LFQTSLTLGITPGELIVLGLGGYLVMQGQVTIGTLLAFIGLLASLFQPVGTLANIGQTLQRASGALERITALLDEPVTIADPPAAMVLPPLASEVRLEGVTFGYDPTRRVLEEVNLRFPCGEHVAIVGPSGSGKSTVASLLLRFWDPQQGRITCDGHELREVTLSSLRGQIGIVFQDTIVFNTTVRENILLGRPEATDTSTWSECKRNTRRLQARGWPSRALSLQPCRARRNDCPAIRTLAAVLTADALPG
jgi:ATP-binding cassette subfamily B protein